MWLDSGGLEPPPNADRQEPHLLRPPKKSAPSLLDGPLFFERLEEAFLALLNNIHGRRTTQVDLRLTTTSFEGRSEPLRDDLDADCSNATIPGIGDRVGRLDDHRDQHGGDALGEGAEHAGGELDFRCHCRR